MEVENYDVIINECRETIKEMKRLKGIQQRRNDRETQRMYQREYYLRRKQKNKIKIMFLNVPENICNRLIVKIESKPTLIL